MSRRNPRLIAAVVAVIVALAGVGLPAGGVATQSARPAIAAAPVHFSVLQPFNTSRSANWAGYQQGLVEHTTMFQQVAATWPVPTASAHHPGVAEFSAQWVGIGGGCPDPACTVPAIDPTLIQAGTAHEVAADGTVAYYAWWEILPLPPTRITDLAVHPGDAMRVDIRGETGQWTITVANDTAGEATTKTVNYPAAMTTAEWILEAPTVAGDVGPAPMPVLGGVRFDAAQANGQPANLDASEAVAMSDTSGQTVASPSQPDAQRDGFAICQWTDNC